MSTMAKPAAISISRSPTSPIRSVPWMSVAKSYQPAWRAHCSITVPV